MHDMSVRGNPALSPRATDARPWYRHAFVWLILAILAWSVVAGLTLVYVAVTNADDVVSDTWYRDGRGINRDMAAERMAEALAIRVLVRRDGDAQARLQWQSDTEMMPPESLELALSTAMAKSASSRYSSAHAFALALQRIQAELNLSVTPFEVLEEPRAEENHADEGFEETRVRSVASIDPDATGNTPTFPARFPTGDTGTTADNATTFNKQGFTSAGFTNPGFRNETAPRPLALPGFDTPGAGTAAGAAADDDLAATVNRSSAAAAPDRGDGSADAAAGEHPAGHGRRNLLLSIVGGTVLVAAVVLGIVAGTTRPEPAPKATDQVSKPPADALDNGTVPDVAGLAGVAGPAGKVSFTWTNPQPKPGDSYKWRVHTLKGDGEYQATAGPAAEMAANPAEPSCIQVMIVRSDGASSPLGPDSIACVPK